jgi:hypothetical protein
VHGNLGVYYRIDGQEIALSVNGELFFRPPSPILILREDVQKNAAVDQNFHQLNVASHQFQQFVGGTFAGTSSAHALDERATTARWF